MCGRYALFSKPGLLAGKLNLPDLPENWAPRYNMAPGTQIPGIRHDDELGQITHDSFWWGFHPQWAGSTAPTPINAQAEHLESSKYFRGAFHHHRCLIPANGWYEWQPHIETKQPYYITRGDRELFFFAGITETMKDGKSCCAIITMPARGGIGEIHPRMPLALDDNSLSAWLDPQLQDRDAIQKAAKPLDSAELTYWPVSRRVNRTANDSEDLVTPIQYKD